MSNKRGRPLSNNKREYEYHLRLNKKEWETLQKLINSGVIVSKVLRKALNKCAEDYEVIQSNSEEGDEFMEIVRKVSRAQVQHWGESQEDAEIELSSRRNRAWKVLDINDHLTINDVCAYLGLDQSREGMTLGWQIGSLSTKVKINFFTWAFCADGSMDITFHNLKDISDLYKTEEELA